MSNENMNKYVVFDLDETIGHFILIRNIWASLMRFISYNKLSYTLTQNDFNTILDKFPELFRPGILHILSSLKKKKQQGSCKGIMIYTNNRYHKEWVYMLMNYIEYKLGGGVFDNIILAFKLDGVIQEPCRTSKDKKYTDFIRCCRLPYNIELCYFDDVVYPEMDVDNVYYLKVKPYIYFYTPDEIMKRLFKVNIVQNLLYNPTDNAAIIEKNKEIFTTYLLKYLEMKRVVCVDKDPVDFEVDKIVTKRMVTHLHVFFTRFFPGFIDDE